MLNMGLCPRAALTVSTVLRPFSNFYAQGRPLLKYGTRNIALFATSLCLPKACLPSQQFPKHYGLNEVRWIYTSPAYRTPDKRPWLDGDSKDFRNNQSGGSDKEKEKNWRNIKYSIIGIGSVFVVSAAALSYNLGKPQLDEEGNEIEDKFSGLPPLKQFLSRLVSQLEYYNDMFKAPSREKLLPDPLKYPYIQPPYTLVLELTDVLVHPEWTYQTGWRFKKRPGVDKFLQQVGPPNFEIVVYTAEQGLTVFPILDALDPNGYIMYRLVRDATDYIDGHHVKNLDCLNRDLKKVIVVDWNDQSVKLHRNNTFLIPKWKGEDEDKTLMDLAAFLNAIAINEVEDVRDVLVYYRQFDNPIQAFKDNQKRLLEQMEQKEKIEKERQRNPTLKWSSGLFNTKR